MGFKFAQPVPKFDTGIAAHFPVFPGDVGFVEAFVFGVERVGEEAQPARIGHAVYQALWLVCKGC